MASERILIIDDDEGTRHLLRDVFVDRYQCLTAGSGTEALDILRSVKPDLVISDINMPGMSGLDVIPMIFDASPDAVVMMITGGRTVDDAIAAMRAGAFDFIKKPFDIDQVELAVERALQHHSLLLERKEHAARLEDLVAERTRRLEYLAYYDEPTGLPNRSYFNERLHQVVSNAASSDEGVAVMLLAPHRFRGIRDALGYEASNDLIRMLAERVQVILPSDITLARLEESELGFLIPSLSDPSDPTTIASLILDALRSPFEVDHHRIMVNASIGISLCPEDGTDATSLIKNAGVALALADHSAANTCEFFSGDMHASALRRLRLENDLRKAAEAGELHAHYQPKIDMDTGRVLGMEALLRWKHPTLGDIDPTEFIGIAEDSGSIIEIGEWILKKACAQAALWRQAGHMLTISVNLSPLQFAVGLAETIRSVLEESGLEPSALNLEVTESSIMKDAALARSVLKQVKALGATFSIDDFGTGYSSLGHLRSLPIDVLKIDKSFVSDVNTHPDSAALVMGIVNLAHNLGLKVVAEGVESKAQLDFLNLLRCDEWQGFLFSKPVSADDIADMLVNGPTLKQLLAVQDAREGLAVDA